MARWVYWTDRVQEFAPVLYTHSLEPYRPVGVEAFVEHDCVLRLFQDGKHKTIKPFTNAGTLIEKYQWMMRREFNSENATYLKRYPARKHSTDMLASVAAQTGHDTTVYTIGFRRTDGGPPKGYILYYFFLLENFVVWSKNVSKARVRDNLQKWWDHQGDWEAVSLEFGDDLQANPSAIHLSQHIGMEHLDWTKTKKRRKRPLVYLSLGSHASYNQPTEQPRRAGFKTYYDLTDAGREFKPSGGYTLRVMDPARSENLWLRFKGEWGGTPRFLFTPPPHGPRFKKKQHFRWLDRRWRMA